MGNGKSNFCSVSSYIYIYIFTSLIKGRLADQNSEGGILTYIGSDERRITLGVGRLN
jgi:hypothetical protein